MKTIKQIKQKVFMLRQYLKERPICENFGDDAQRKLADYIGDIYGYPYETRLEIEHISHMFFEWCINFTGK